MYDSMKVCHVFRVMYSWRNKERVPDCNSTQYYYSYIPTFCILCCCAGFSIFSGATFSRLVTLDGDHHDARNYRKNVCAMNCVKFYDYDNAHCTHCAS